MELYKKLTTAGFNVVHALSKNEISKSLLERYANLPSDYLQFLKNFESISNSTNTTWFNLNSDFNGETGSEFKWNEFELLSLEWSEDDKEELMNIKEFWKFHIPIVLSVNDGYQFFAICLEDEKYGEIVHGQEPVFEDVSKICNSFIELIDLLEKKQISNMV